MWAPYFGWYPCHCTPDCPALPIVHGGRLALNASDNNGIASRGALKISGGNIIFQGAPTGINGRDPVTAHDVTIIPNSSPESVPEICELGHNRAVVLYSRAMSRVAV
jgi:hypothetical protein